MDCGEIERLFTRADGAFCFARWERAQAPVIFGLADESMPVFKGAIEAVAHLSGRGIAQTDPELGANFMWFFCGEWAELLTVPHLDRLVHGLGGLVRRLQAADANQYRVFRFDAQGAICACFVFLRMDAQLVSVPAQDLALAQAAQSALLWSDLAFRTRSLLARGGGRTLLHPSIAALIRTAYDPVLPGASDDPAFALRLAARIGAAQ